MPVRTLSCECAPVRPAKCTGLGRVRRTAIIATLLGASARSAIPFRRAKQIPRALSGGTPFRVDSTPFIQRLQECVTDPAHLHTNVMLTMISLDFAARVPSIMACQDKLAPLLMRNAPAAAACFALNAWAWADLGHFSEREAGVSRTAAVWLASCAAQTATRRALSLPPIPTLWVRLSGAVLGLVGAKIVYDARHTWRDYGWPIHHSAGVVTTVTVVSLVESVPVKSSLRMPHDTEYQEHLICAGLACALPGNPWCKLSALCAGALTAYLFGPHWVSGMVRAPEGKPFHVEGFSEPLLDWFYKDDRPPLPWLATPDAVLVGMRSSQASPETMANLSIADLDNFPERVGKKDD